MGLAMPIAPQKAKTIPVFAFLLTGRHNRRQIKGAPIRIKGPLWFYFKNHGMMSCAGRGELRKQGHRHTTYFNEARSQLLHLL